MGCCTNFWNKAKTKIKSWHKEEFRASAVRGVILGNIITVTIAEVAAYRIIIQDVRVGALPVYLPYLLLCLLAIVEALLAPLVSWLGYNVRRKIILGWSLAVIAISFAWFLLPPPDTLSETEFCNPSNRNPTISYRGLSIRPAIRLIVTIITALGFCLSRVAIWSHYMAYSDDYAPERTSMHFGVLVIARVIPLIFGYKMLTLIVETNVLFKTLIITINMVVNIIRLYFDLPINEPRVRGEIKTVSMDNRGFFRSIPRVLFNLVAMSQMMAMGFMAAAFWGLGYNEEEIVKTNYNILPQATNVIHHTEFFRYFLAIVSVAYIGVKHSAPIREEYDIDRALLQVRKMTIFAFILYIVITVAPPCKKGIVAGMENNHYVNPTCSLGCGCVPRWREFSPVCVVDTMTTYTSPCEAGCRGSDVIDNLPVYSNCSCAGVGGQAGSAGWGRAAPGACSISGCYAGYNFHLSLYSLIVCVTVLAFQSQGTIILKSVDPRDKSLAMGLMWSVVAAAAFVFANSIFYFIAARNCAWWSGDKCQLYSDRFPYLVGYCCAGLVLLALSLGFVPASYRRLANTAHTTHEDD